MANYFYRLFSGRINGKTYSLGLFLLVAGVLFTLFVTVAFSRELEEIKKTPMGDLLENVGIYVGVAIFMLYLYSFQVRRLHDAGYGGIWETLGNRGEVASNGEKHEN